MVKLFRIFMLWPAALLFGTVGYGQNDTLRISGSSYFDEKRTLVLCNYISSQLKMPVKYENIASTRHMHDLLREGKVDLAMMNTFQYVFAKSDNISNIEPFMILGDSVGNAKTYRSCLIVRPFSGYRSLDQLIRSSDKVKLDFAYVASTSGHIVPRMQLATLGVPYPEAQFSSIHFSGGHLDAINAVIHGKADAAFVSVDDLLNYQLAGQVPKNAVRMIWESDPITQSPVVIRRDLPQNLKRDLRNLFLHIHQDEPAVWHHLQENWGAVDPVRFVDATAADFVLVQQAADKVGKLVYFLNYYEEQLAQQAQELTKGDQLIEGQLAKMNAQKKVLDQQIVQIRTQTFSLYLLGMIVLGIIAVIIFVIRANRSKQQLNVALVQKNDELEHAVYELKLAQDQLVHSEKMASLGLLTAGIAHEINNPVNFIFTGINGLEKNMSALLKVNEVFEQVEETSAENLQQLKTKIADQKRLGRYADVKESLLDFIDGIRLGARRTADIVSGLRNFARTDESERTLAHVHQCLDSTMVLLRYKLKQDGIELVIEYDQAVPQMACYPGPLNQVFMNLFTNAVHAIEAVKDQRTGKIRLKTVRRGDFVEITIGDNGIGIPKEMIGKVFDPFFTTKAVGEGTGLGLSITYGIIQKHHGTLRLESEEGIGTTFFISLPTNLTLT